MTVNELTYFTVTGNWNDVEQQPLIGPVTQPTFNIISALVTFYPRLPTGFVAYIDNLDTNPPSGTGADVALAIAPIQARILSGQLETIDSTDTAGVQLLANSTIISTALTTQNTPPPSSGLAIGVLAYDVKFTNVIYNAATQLINNFAFTAPTTNTPVILTAAELVRLPYQGP